MKHDRSDRKNALGELTATERELLELLAHGHTAKSIAQLTGMSVGAVNERFRAARRKTGAGSSRELARMLRSQNLDPNFIGVAQGAGSAAGQDSPAPAHRSSWRSLTSWSIAMAAAALIALVLAVQTPPDIPSDPPGPAAALTAAPFLEEEPPKLRELHGEVHAKAKADGAALATEATVRSWYQRAPGFAGAAESLNVTCAGTLCEVLVHTREGLLSPALSAFVAGMQSGELNAATESGGFTVLVKSFASSREDPSRNWHVAYLRKTAKQ